MLKKTIAILDKSRLPIPEYAGDDLLNMYFVSLIHDARQCYDAIPLLVSRDLDAPVEILLRAILERLITTHWVLCGKIRTIEWRKKQLRDELAMNMMQFLNSMSRHDQSIARLINRLKADANSGSKTKTTSLADRARQCGLGDLYDWAYRTSSQYVHGSLLASLRYITLTPDGRVAVQSENDSSVKVTAGSLTDVEVAFALLGQLTADVALVVGDDKALDELEAGNPFDLVLPGAVTKVLRETARAKSER